MCQRYLSQSQLAQSGQRYLGGTTWLTPYYALIIVEHKHDLFAMLLK